MPTKNYNFSNQVRNLFIHTVLWMNIFLYAGFQLIQYDTVHFIEQKLSADQTEISFDLDENLLAEQGADVFDAECYMSPAFIVHQSLPHPSNSQQVHTKYKVNLSLAVQDIQSPPPQI